MKGGGLGGGRDPKGLLLPTTHALPDAGRQAKESAEKFEFLTFAFLGVVLVLVGSLVHTWVIILQLTALLTFFNFWFGFTRRGPEAARQLFLLLPRLFALRLHFSTSGVTETHF